MIRSSNELAQAGGKKTISPQDVMASLKDAELEGFMPRLEAELKSESFLYTEFNSNLPFLWDEQKIVAV